MVLLVNSFYEDKMTRDFQMLSFFCKKLVYWPFIDLGISSSTYGFVLKDCLVLNFSLLI